MNRPVWPLSARITFRRPVHVVAPGSLRHDFGSTQMLR
jgi:hypothetical protein